MANETSNPEESEESMKGQSSSVLFGTESPNGDDGFNDVSFDSMFEDEAPVDDLFETKEGSGDELSELEREMAALDEFAVPEMDFSGNVDVFTTLEEGEETEEGAEESKEKKKKMPVFLIVAIAIGAVLLIIVITLVISVVSYQMRQNREAEPIPIPVLTKPADLPNDFNYMLVNDAKDLGNQVFHIKKIVMDSVATVFYFNEDIDIMDYNFVLYDSDGTAHAMDLAHMLEDLTVRRERDPYARETIVRFEPFEVFSPSMVLEVTDIYTEEKITFTYVLSADANTSGARHLTEPINVPISVDNVELTLERATFSPAGSIIGYKIQWLDEQGQRIQFSGGDRPDSVQLREAGVTISPQRNSPIEYELGSSIIGRMDFGAIRNLDSTVEISFGNAFVNLKHDETISLEPLFLNTPESEIHIDIGDYRVVLERIALQGSTYVLVFHAIDKTLPVRGPEDYSNRVQVDLAANIHVNARDGMEITLEGRSRVSPIGTDMLFLAGGMASYLNTLPTANLLLQISDIGIEMNDISVSLDLSQFDTKLKYEHNAILSRIELAFRSRLSYKSGTVWRDSILGFSRSILLDEELMRNYHPPADLKQNPFYSAQILAYTFESERMLFAIVQETWQGITEEAEIHFYRKHQIRAEKIGEEWMIVENVLIE